MIVEKDAQLRGAIPEHVEKQTLLEVPAILREARVAAATWVVARENREVRIIGFIAGKSEQRRG